MINEISYIIHTFTGIHVIKLNLQKCKILAVRQWIGEINGLDNPVN
jgi:hypothetical protein